MRILPATASATATDLASASPRTTKGSAVRTLRDTWLIYRRSLILTLRQPVWVAMGIFQPILYLTLFGPLLDGATAAAGATGSAFNWFIPGLLVQTAFFAAAFAGFGLVAELRYGVVERMRVTPMSRFAMLSGRSLRDVTILVIQSALMIAIAVPFGLQLEPLGALLTLGLVALIGLTFALLSYAAALVLKTEDALAPVIQGVALPILLLSGILLPMTLAPDWLQTLSTLNPLTHAVDAARALFNGVWDDPQIRVGVTVMGVLAVIALWVASRAFSRATA
jgi:ABC-2 type transport system permease protein